MKLFLNLVLTTSLVRMIAFLICTMLFVATPGQFIKNSNYDMIEAKMDEAAEDEISLWLPLDPEPNFGINKAPNLVILCLFLPELLFLITYLTLVWMTFQS